MVRDATDALLPAAAVELSNPVTGFARAARTAEDGTFAIYGVPLNSYAIRISLAGFQPYRAAIVVRTAIPLDLKVRLELAAA